MVFGEGIFSNLCGNVSPRIRPKKAVFLVKEGFQSEIRFAFKANKAANSAAKCGSAQDSGNHAKGGN
jgi:hypothetical protein